MYHPARINTHNEFTRMLVEHGLFGLLATVMLVILVVKRVAIARDPEEKAVIAALLIWSSLNIFVNGMRVSAPCFFIALALSGYAALPAVTGLKQTRRTL
jgi:hypothetical protein